LPTFEFRRGGHAFTVGARLRASASTKTVNRSFFTTSQAVGQELDISVRTVEKHVQNIYARIGARNRSEAISILLGNSSSGSSASGA
jgi:hypothetical protein